MGEGFVDWLIGVFVDWFPSGLLFQSSAPEEVETPSFCLCEEVRFWLGRMASCAFYIPLVIRLLLN